MPKINIFYPFLLSVDMKPPIKIEDVVKNEVKTEVVEPSANAGATTATPINSGPAPMGQMAPKKEEEYDSSATVR